MASNKINLYCETVDINKWIGNWSRNNMSTSDEYDGADVVTFLETIVKDFCDYFDIELV